LRFHRIDPVLSTSPRADRRPASRALLACSALVAALCVFVPQCAHCQDAAGLPTPKAQSSVETPIEAKTQVSFENPAPSEIAPEAMKVGPMEATYAAGDQRPAKKPVESELIVEGLMSYGNYTIFASGYDMKLFTGGVEYDRHSWGRFLKADADYVAEFLPFVLLDKPLYTAIYGTPTYGTNKNIRQYVPGVGISPIGFRLQWRSKKTIKPYLEAKAGVIAFTKKVPSSEASYENFSLQSAMGVQVKMSERWGLRLGLFSDFHFSNGFVVPINPGLDVMNANLGISYHFAR
jgi:hypothetical protein